MKILAGLLLISLLSGCDKERVAEDPMVTRGRELFQDPKFDTKLSVDHSFSCATCHPNGNMDNKKWHFPEIHGSHGAVPDSFVTLTCWGVAESGPSYLWTGRYQGVDRLSALDSVTRLYTDRVMGGSASQEEIDALVAYQQSLRFPRNPNLRADGHLTAQQLRGKELYENDNKGFCAPCHPAPMGTNFSIKNIGTGGFFKTTALRWAFENGPYYHDGRKKTLREVIDFYADTAFVGKISLTNSEREDLIEYLKTF